VHKILAIMAFLELLAFEESSQQNLFSCRRFETHGDKFAVSDIYEHCQADVYTKKNGLLRA
jgi:hypothetical protein